MNKVAYVLLMVLAWPWAPAAIKETIQFDNKINKLFEEIKNHD